MKEKKSEQYFGGRSRLVFLSQLKDIPDWNDKSLAPLCNSLSERGQLQQIVVAPAENKRGFKIIAGRLIAAAMLRNKMQRKKHKDFEGPKVQSLSTALKWNKARVFQVDDLDEYDGLEVGFMLNNLGSNKWDLIDFAMKISVLKDAYEKKYPETKQGANGGGRDGKGTKCRNTENLKNQSSVCEKGKLSFFNYMSKKLGQKANWLWNISSLAYLTLEEQVQFAEGSLTLQEARKIATIRKNYAKGQWTNKDNKELKDFTRKIKKKGMSEVELAKHLLKKGTIPKTKTGLEFCNNTIEQLESLKVKIEETLSEHDEIQDLGQKSIEVQIEEALERCSALFNESICSSIEDRLGKNPSPRLKRVSESWSNLKNAFTDLKELLDDPEDATAPEAEL